MGRRDEVLSAAIEVLGTVGLRGLTHRAVDTTARVPAGTTSNHFRTRDALVTGIVGAMVEQDLGFWSDGAAPPPDPGAVLDVLTGFVAWSTGPGRVRTVARMNLFAAAATDPGISAALRGGREAVAALGRAVGGAIGLDPQATGMLMDLTDALITRQAAFPDPDFDPRPVLRRALTALAEPPPRT